MKSIKVQKQDQWVKLKQMVDELTDGVGYPVDERIKEMVVALWAHEVPTLASCEGHLNQTGVAPWVDIGKNPSRDDLKELKNQPIPTREIFRKYTHLQKIRLKNLKIQQDLLNLLSQFYRNHSVLEDERLILLQKGIYGAVSLINQGVEIQELNIKSKQKEKLKKYQQEMNYFAEFLKNKFLEE